MSCYGSEMDVIYTSPTMNKLQSVPLFLDSYLSPYWAHQFFLSGCCFVLFFLSFSLGTDTYPEVSGKADLPSTPTSEAPDLSWYVWDLSARSYSLYIIYLKIKKSKFTRVYFYLLYSNGKLIGPRSEICLVKITALTLSLSSKGVHRFAQCRALRRSGFETQHLNSS